MNGSTLLSVALAAGALAPPTHPGPEGPAPAEASASENLDLADQAWQRRYRRLRAQTGVSWGLTAVGILGTVIPLAKLVSYGKQPGFIGPDTGFVEIITIPMFAALTAAALVPAIIYTSRLVDHRRRRPIHAHLQPAPGGILLRF